MKKIGEKEFKKITEQNPNVKVINVLSEDDFEEGHIPNSINIPVESEDFLDQVKNEVRNKNDMIIVYCANNACTASTQAAQILEENGYTKVLDFKGGMEEWKQAGNQVTAGV